METPLGTSATGDGLDEDVNLFEKLRTVSIPGSSAPSMLFSNACLGTRSLEEGYKVAVELVERGGVDLGHLEYGDVEADDKEALDESH